MAGADRADQTESDASPVDGGRRKPAGGGVVGLKDFTDVGPRSGPILWRDDCAAIGCRHGSVPAAPETSTSAVGLSGGALMEPGEGASPRVEARLPHPIGGDAMIVRDRSVRRLIQLRRSCDRRYPQQGHDVRRSGNVIPTPAKR
jgi:hypothetical protein